MMSAHSCFDCKYLEQSINKDPCTDCLYGCYWEPKEEDDENIDQDTV